MYNDVHLRVARSYTSSADSPFSLISSLRLSGLPSTLTHSTPPPPVYFHSHRPPSYVVLLYSHHITIPLQPSFLDFLCDFPHFLCPCFRTGMPFSIIDVTNASWGASLFFSRYPENACLNEILVLVSACMPKVFHCILIVWSKTSRLV